MKQIAANTITNDFLTSRGGLDIGKKIELFLKSDPLSLIEVSFSGVSNVAPSFVNGSFLYLIDNYGADYFKKHIKVINASPEVAKTISESVGNYLNRQKAFFDTLKLNKLFFASDGSEKSNGLISELKKISLENGFYNIASPENLGTTEYRKQLIETSDALIGILTDNDNKEYLGEQLEIAVNADKPCILLVHTNLNLRLPTNSHDKVHCIYYDDSNYLDQLRRLNKIILDNKKNDSGLNLVPPNNNANNETAALGAIIAIALLAVLLFLALGNNKNNKE